MEWCLIVDMHSFIRASISTRNAGMRTFETFPIANFPFGLQVIDEIVEGIAFDETKRQVIGNDKLGEELLGLFGLEYYRGFHNNGVVNKIRVTFFDVVAERGGRRGGLEKLAALVAKTLVILEGEIFPDAAEALAFFGVAWWWWNIHFVVGHTPVILIKKQELSKDIKIN